MDTTTRLLPLFCLCACSLLPPEPHGERPLQDKANRVAAETARIRDLELRSAVPVGIKTKADVKALCEKEIDKEWGEKGAGLERAFKLFGLLPPDMDLKPWLADYMKDNVAGYYDTETKEFFTIEKEEKKGAATEDGQDEEEDEDSGGGEEREKDFVMAHELTHAIDDQHFDLEAIEKAGDFDEDESLAFTALAEGCAMEGSVDYLLWRGGVPLSTSGPLLSPVVRLLSSEKMLSFAKDAGEEVGSKLPDAPPIIERPLIFPYIEGWGFANRIRSEFGWEGVNAAYRDPPESSEQILFPERYLDRRDRPVRIDLPDPPLGWKQAHEETLGMYGMRVLLATLLDEGAADDADGWDGDRYVVWEGPEGDVLGWVTVWDYESDAKDFAGAYRALLCGRCVEDGSWSVLRNGDMVAAVQHAPAGQAEEAARHLLGSTVTRAPDDQPPERWYWKVLRFPLGLRFLDRAFEAHVAGGALLDYRGSEGGHCFEILDLSYFPGAMLLSESSPDRSAFWLGFGLAGCSSDRTLDYSFARVPLIFNWHSRGEGDAGSTRLSSMLRFVDYFDERGSGHFNLVWGSVLSIRWGEEATGGRNLRLFFVPVPGT
ncbi:MAG: hypothetical protein HY812_05130 [Planctomycetes bacterium]|nr:hypothetical protein [Planctomycetota bacterium]